VKPNGTALDPTHTLYRDTLLCLRDSQLPFLVGGAFALERYAGLLRPTKDLDIFVCGSDRFALMDHMNKAGFTTEWKFPHWLGKAWKGEQSIDIIFNSGNGLCAVDELWFRHALPSTVLDVDVLLVPPEEMLWSKAFVMERNRYDGGDIAHLLRARAKTMDWARLLLRFNGHWRVLFSHIILFGFIYPEQRLRVPDWFMNEMMRRLELDMQSLPSDRRVCQGTLLSWSQYLGHLAKGEYEDARHVPRGKLTNEETLQMTQVLQREEREPHT